MNDEVTEVVCLTFLGMVGNNARVRVTDLDGTTTERMVPPWTSFLLRATPEIGSDLC